MITTTPPAAGIGTATVDLKTLTVNGRRMTLTVFRQIREQPLIADDGTLNGQPWGMVNYHPDRCGDSQLTHWHIVWQRGSELLRTRVHEKPTFDWPTHYVNANPQFQSPDTDRYLTAAVHEWINDLTETLVLKKETYRSYNPTLTLIDNGITVRGTVSDKAIAAVNSKHQADNPEPQPWANSPHMIEQRKIEQQQATAEAEQARDALNEEIDNWHLTPIEVNHAYHAAIAAELERRQRHRDIRAQLAELPQLFIAL
ncbi:hypothetical protein [Nonomuraea sp. NPDC048901]|uniref:hypothetical protein n=1 Tax=Nonomuraea sp. NPDC048901 TaxID=3155627 RepID=UPI0033C18655